MAAHSMVFLAAGYESTSSTAAFAVYELAQNRPILEKTRDEIFTVLKRNNGEITYETLAEMDYLTLVIEGKCFDRLLVLRKALKAAAEILLILVSRACYGQPAKCGQRFKCPQGIKAVFLLSFSKEKVLIFSEWNLYSISIVLYRVLDL